LAFFILSRYWVSLAYLHRCQALRSSLVQDLMGPGGRADSGTVPMHLTQVFENALDNEVIERADSMEKNMIIVVGVVMVTDVNRASFEGVSNLTPPRQDCITQAEFTDDLFVLVRLP
jgi:hypothetical protein